MSFIHIYIYIYIGGFSERKTLVIVWPIHCSFKVILLMFLAIL